jgi:hypothetical protein
LADWDEQENHRLKTDSALSVPQLNFNNCPISNFTP